MPSEMIWDTESLFQHSHPHTSGGLRSVAAAEVSMAAAAELQGFGPTQLCLSPAISPALAVPCALPYPSHQSHVRLPRVKFRSWQEKSLQSRVERGKNEFLRVVAPCKHKVQVAAGGRGMLGWTITGVTFVAHRIPLPRAGIVQTGKTQQNCHLLAWGTCGLSKQRNQSVSF